MLTFQVVATFAVVMIWSTLIGRRFAQLLPDGIKANAQTYLASALGLGFIVCVGFAISRVSSFHQARPFIIGLMVVSAAWAWHREERKRETLVECALAVLVSLISASAMLFGVIKFGGFSTYNDAYTYLQHGQWLQGHIYVDPISPEQVDANNSQVALYQKAQLRMGASYALAWIQSFSGLTWSFAAYPVAVILAVGSFSLATVFVASLVFRLPVATGYLLACLPGLASSGLSFGALTGFLPQIFGMSAALTFLALGGALLREAVIRPDATAARFWVAAVPLALAFCALTFSYSELVPFVVISAATAATAVLLFCGKARIAVLQLLVAFGAISLIVLNWEIARAIDAIRSQSNAVVGWPMPWSLLDLAGHAFGIRGTHHAGWLFAGAQVGAVILAVIVIAIALVITRMNKVDTLVILPFGLFLFVSSAALIYFRYMVPSPFPVGIGQSWSQFKLSDWGFLAIAPLIACAMSATVRTLGYRSMQLSVVILVGVGVWQSYKIGTATVRSIVVQIGAQNDMVATFISIRDQIGRTTKSDDRIYLNLRGDLHKLRQTLAYFLSGRTLASDWTDDGYIHRQLPADKVAVPIESTAYTVAFTDNLPSQAVSRAMWRVGRLAMLKTSDFMAFATISARTGGYEREAAGGNWWHWVNDKITFHVRDAASRKDIRISLELSSANGADVLLTVVGERGEFQQTVTFNKRFTPTPVTRTIPASVGRILRMELSGFGDGVRLGKTDARTARFQVANVDLVTDTSN